LFLTTLIIYHNLKTLQAKSLIILFFSRELIKINFDY
jgi:hypothetical protein